MMTLAAPAPMIDRMVMSGIERRSNERVTVVLPDPALTEAQKEQACINAVIAGDANAFQTLVETHQARVLHLALRMLGNEQEAQDAAQDAFVQAYTRLASYRPDWRFKTWIMTITSNLCIDRLRRRRIEPLAFSDQPEDTELSYISSEPPPDVMADRHERRATIQAMLSVLPPDDRSMIVMFYWGDMSYDEIAHATGSTVNAVKSRLFRARRALAASPLAERFAATGLGASA